MGKKQRNRANSAATYAAGRGESANNTKKILKIVCAVLVVAIIGGLVIYDKVVNSGFYLRNTVSVQSDNYKVNNAMMSYYFHAAYNQAYQELYYYYASMGLDPTKSLKDQKMSANTTWFDYFMEQTTSSVKEVLVLAEAAKAAGVELDEDANKLIDAQIKNLKAVAKASGQSENYYIRSMYGFGVNLNDIKDALKIQTLSSKYYTSIQEELAERFTQADYDKYYEENPFALVFADTLSYTFKFTPEKSADDDKTKTDKYTEDEANYESIMKYANELAAVADADAFKAYVRDYVTNVVYDGYKIVDDTKTETTDKPKATDATKTDATKTDATKTDEKTVKQSVIDKAVDAIVKDRVQHVDEDEQSDWVFDTARAEFDTRIDKAFAEKTNEYSVTVTMVSAPRYRDDYTTKGFGHILFGVGDYGNYATKEEAKAEAERILAEYKSGEMTRDAFDKLARKYTNDSNAFYDNVQKGEMVEEMNDWIYDESRKVGDVEIIETMYGYHVTFFDGDGEAAWTRQADKNLINETYAEMYKDFESKYKVKIDKAALAVINA